MKKTKLENMRNAAFLQAGAILILLFWLATTGFGQTTGAETPMTATAVTQPAVKVKALPAPALMPVMKNYKDVFVGMSADDVKDKLGKAKIEDKTGFYYKFSDDEAAQIGLSADRKVQAISIMYSGKSEKAPQVETIFGSEATVTPAADGSIYKVVRYPEAGYWVAYSKTTGENPMVIVTLQKL